MPNWVFLLVRFTLSAAFVALATWIGWKLGGRPWMLVALVFTTPAVGVAIAKPLVELSHEGITWLAEAHAREWEGRYYQFNGVQIRVYEDGDRLWFTADDVMKACDMKAIAATFPAVYPAHCRKVSGAICFDPEGIESFFEDNRNTELGRLMMWAKREVVTPWERKRSGALVPR